MKLSNGTIVHFRQPGLKEGRTKEGGTKDIIRYYKIVGELGQGRRTVYTATPVRKVVPFAEKAEKRKRTTTDDSVVAVEAGPSGSAAKAGDDEHHPIELGSSVVPVEPSVVPVDSTTKLPISIVEVGSSSIVLPAPAQVIEVGTSRGAKGRFVSKKKKKTAKAGGFGAPADSVTTSSSSPRMIATTSIQPSRPIVAASPPIPIEPIEKFEDVPGEPDVAIKFDYMSAREHRSVPNPHPWGIR